MAMFCMRYILLNISKLLTNMYLFQSLKQAFEEKLGEIRENNMQICMD